MMTLRKKLDALLHKHDVDVCRLFAVVNYCFAAFYVIVSLVEMLKTKKFDGGVVGSVFPFFLGRALWEHKSWARVVQHIIIVLFFASCGAGLILFIISPFMPSWRDESTGVGQYIACLLVCMAGLTLSCFLQLLLLSRKIDKEMFRATPFWFSFRKDKDGFGLKPQPVSPFNRRLHFIIIGVMTFLTFVFCLSSFVINE